MNGSLYADFFVYPSLREVVRAMLEEDGLQGLLELEAQPAEPAFPQNLQQLLLLEVLLSPVGRVGEGDRVEGIVEHLEGNVADQGVHQLLVMVFHQV